MRTLEISSEPVELCKILKLEGSVSSGGEAKAEIALGKVMLNGKIETRKRKKIVAGDIVEYGNQNVCVRLRKNP